jgi:hypothetical protein
MRRVFATLIAASLAVAGAVGQEATPPTLDVVLARAALYVAGYQKRLQGIVAEEVYIQNYMRTTRTRRMAREGRQLRSDVLLVKLAGNERWLQFRDVFEVDRRPVRDRDQRLYKLFVDAKADASAQAQTIQEESARYNLGPVLRTINIPIMAMLFFERANQASLEFALGKAGNVKRFADLCRPEDIVMIAFRENGPGTMVKGEKNRDIPSNGRAWIDRNTGRILRTELITQDTQLRALVEVTYKATPGLDFLVPGEMREIYTVGQNDTRIDGRATYDKFRQFSVSTSEKPKSN